MFLCKFFVGIFDNITIIIFHLFNIIFSYIQKKIYIYLYTYYFNNKHNIFLFFVLVFFQEKFIHIKRKNPLLVYLFFNDYILIEILKKKKNKIK